MKKFLFFFIVTLLSIGFVSCEYDDDALWKEIEQVKDRVTELEKAVKNTNNNITALQTIVEALQRNVYVTAVNTTADGYEITFSDGKKITIANGKDGKDGVNAPVISLKQDTDGNYYWTLDGEWLVVDGERVRANGIDGVDGEDGEDGADGKDGIAPQVRVNNETKEWEISIDGGETWVSTGVVAEGKDGASGSYEAEDSLFKSVDVSNSEYVVITLADGTEFKLARYNDGAPLLVIVEAPELAQIEYGKSVEFVVKAQNVTDYTINVPEGWKATIEDTIFTVTAPAKDLCHYDKEGEIAITVVSETGMSAITKLNVCAGEWVEEVTLRTLTFESGSEKFTSYKITGYDSSTGSYYEHTVGKWTDLIDTPEYSGPLCYGDMGFSGESRGCDYHWYDEGNTYLASEFPENYNARVYWGGGHVVSNYASTDYKTYGTYMNQQTVYGTTGAGGRNGSSNFAMHFGYKDGSPYNGTENLPYIYFGDGEARVIDHMWVNNSCYAISCYMDGNGLTAAVGESDWVKVVATGYGADNMECGTAEFYLCNGPENIVTEWQKWDLTSLGNVLKVEFNITGSSDNGYGFSQPAYFAYDDVAVQFGGDKVFK